MYTINGINEDHRSVLHESDADTPLKLNSGKINTEINAIPSFSFSISALNPNYDELKDRETIIEAHNDLTGDNDFEGIMVHSKERVSASGTIDKLCTCEGFMTYLNESIQPYHHYENTNVTSFLSSLLAYHNSRVLAEVSKNLFYLTNPEQTISGLTISADEKGRVVINGTSTERVKLLLMGATSVSDTILSSGTYTAKIEKVSGTVSTANNISLRYGNVSSGSGTRWVNNTTPVETDTFESDQSVILNISSNTEFTNAAYEIQIVEGDTVGNFYPHGFIIGYSKQIQLGSVNISGDNNHSKTTAYRSTLEEIKINLIDRLGGEIQVRKTNNGLVLDYLDRIGTVSSTTIELAKNIQTIAIDTDTSNIVTRLVPLGASINDETAERLTIGEVNQGRDYIDDTEAIKKYGTIMGTVIFDDITTAEALKNKAVTYLQNNNRLRKGYAAQVLDLSLLNAPDNNKCIRAGNIYHFIHPLIDLDEELRVLKVQTDIFKPYKPIIEIGDKSETITSIATDTASLLEYELPKQRIDILTSAKATATALINAGINGYVVVNRNEILIMDQPSKEDATYVWRFNVNGWGYSKTGYNGTYTMAATLNSGIVADFITAGVLRGIEIVNGNNTFHVDANGNVDASSLNITGGSINIETSDESTDVIKLRCSGQGVSQRTILTPGAISHKINSNGRTDITMLNGFGIRTTGTITANGGITGGDIIGERLIYKKNGAYYNVQILIDQLWDKVFGGVI